MQIRCHIFSILRIIEDMVEIFYLQGVNSTKITFLFFPTQISQLWVSCEPKGSFYYNLNNLPMEMECT